MEEGIPRMIVQPMINFVLSSDEGCMIRCAQASSGTLVIKHRYG